MKFLKSLLVPIVTASILGAFATTWQVQGLAAVVDSVKTRVDKVEKQIDEIHWFLIRKPKVVTPKEG